MRQQILNILREIKVERGNDDGAKVIVFDNVAELLNELTCAEPKLDGFQLLTAVRDARSLMLDILLRLRNEVHTDRKTELEADKFWDGSMREHFVEDAEQLAAKPETRELYKEVHADEDSGQPLNDFLNEIEDADQDLAMFVYTMLTNDPATV